MRTQIRIVAGTLKGRKLTCNVNPPFAGFQRNLDGLMDLVRLLQQKVAPDSVIVLQGEHDAPLEGLPRLEEWEDRRYGRNHLLIWVRDLPEAPAPAEEPPG